MERGEKRLGVLFLREPADVEEGRGVRRQLQFSAGGGFAVLVAGVEHRRVYAEIDGGDVGHAPIREHGR